jgi:hypothetical protein
LRRDTLRLTTLDAFDVDVTDGEVHVVLDGVAPGRLALTATVTNGPAQRFAASGRHIVLERGGTGVRVRD